MSGPNAKPVAKAPRPAPAVTRRKINFVASKTSRKDMFQQFIQSGAVESYHLVKRREISTLLESEIKHANNPNKKTSDSVNTSLFDNIDPN